MSRAGIGGFFAVAAFGEAVCVACAVVGMERHEFASTVALWLLACLYGSLAGFLFTRMIDFEESR